MRLTICLLLLASFSHIFVPSASSTQPLPYECPTVVVICPVAASDNGKTLTFKAEVRGISPSTKLTYHWRVSTGLIRDGQNTSSIKIDTKGLGNEPVTATVEVGGLSTDCPNKASCTMAAAARATMSR